MEKSIIRTSTISCKEACQFLVPLTSDLKDYLKAVEPIIFENEDTQVLCTVVITILKGEN